MNRLKYWTVASGAALLAGAMFATASSDVWKDEGSCLTREEVQRHMERSRNGISLTCNEEIRLRNLARRSVNEDASP